MLKDAEDALSGLAGSDEAVRSLLAVMPDEVMIIVRDDCAGMPPTRADKAERAAERGSGVG